MCGRFSVTKSTLNDLRGLFPDPVTLKDDWNVAPSRPVSLVRDWDGERTVTDAKWGFVATWAKDFQKSRPQPINAKIENLTSSSMWRGPFARHRGIIVADGYYEWTITEHGKQPHFIHVPGTSLAMAAVIGAWPDPTKADDDPDKWRLSTAIITRDSHVAPGEVMTGCRRA